jgi:hypothetical protein
MTIRFIKSVRVGMALIAGLAIAGPSVAQTLEWRHVQGGKYGAGSSSTQTGGGSLQTPTSCTRRMGRHLGRSRIRRC